MNIYLYFANSNSEVYKEKFQTLADDFLAKRFTENQNRLPRIGFPGMHGATLVQMFLTGRN